MQEVIKDIYFSEEIISKISKILDYPMTIVEAPMGYGKTTAVREIMNRLNANIMLLRVYDNSISNFWNGFCNLFSNFDEAAYQKLMELQFPSDSVSLMSTLNILEAIEFPKNSVIVIDDYHLVECKLSNNFIEFLVKSEVTELHLTLIMRYTDFPNIEELKLKGHLYHIKQEVFEFIPKNIYTLIDEVVYSPLTQKYKDIMVDMCIFDEFTLEQAEYVCRGNNSRLLMEELVRKNAFVTYDYSNKTYHMHSILKKLLLAKFHNQDKEHKETLYKKACYWYMKNTEYILSMKFAYLAGDFDSLLKAIKLDNAVSIHLEHKNLIIKYSDDCPLENKINNPYAMLLLARKMFLFNEVERFKDFFGEFMINIQSIEDKEFKNKLLGEYELLFSFTEYNDIEKMSVHHRRACVLLKEPSIIFHGKETWTMGSPSVLCMFYSKTGELEKEVECIKESMPFYFESANNHGKGADYMMEAERYYYMGDFENAEISVHKTFKATGENLVSGIFICAVFLELRLALIKGDFLKILRLCKKMREDINAKKVYIYMYTLEICEAYIYSLLKNKEHIKPWIKNGEYENTRLYFHAVPFLNIVCGRALLINGEYSKLIDSSESFIRIASIFSNLLGQVQAYIYVAAANNMLLMKNEALEALKKALDISMPDKMYMVFVENCDYLKSLLEQLQGTGYYMEDISRILELYKPYGKAITQIKREHFEDNKPVLSAREMEIAKLGAEGFSNKEIGEKLFISQNTVKTQLKSVFEKLNITSRTLLKQYII